MLAAQVRPPAAPYELVLVTERGFALGGERKWIEALQKAGIRNVRLRSGRGGETPGVENTGTEKDPRYRIVGILRRGNRLVVSGGSYTMSRIPELRKWIDQVRRRGPDAAVGKPEAFGLTAGELAKLHEQLAGRVAVATQGRPLADVVTDITRAIRISVDWTPAAKEALEEADPCLDELKGISAGTALAAALRPAGLTFVPEVIGPGRFRLSVVPTRKAKEHWPVGWPPVLETTKFAPGLMTFAAIEARKTRLRAFLDAISQRTAVPYLLDHNALALADIDSDETRVDLAARRTFYLNHLRRALRPVKLEAILKIDESGRPLLWITTRHRP